ncbi:16S rRNA (guanine(527)-N(7))-methyltransferase RsmG [Sphingobium aromaticiconvertens]|uniref:16S rRNA (guanine(527)-N(7))-methyltransferase RsmG n=1 Tax=Sphingobium aromaticiconvertens TaxID=365341 RepID=UPI003017CB2F
MTEDEALSWLTAHFAVPRETLDRLEAYITLLFAGMAEQNLIAESTREHVWARHIVDSAQLLPLARSTPGTWMDLGSGAGLPGIVVAILSDRPVMLVESRRKRIDFLKVVANSLVLNNVTVFGGRVEAVPTYASAIISARAYAPLPRLLASAVHLADEKTLWLLPKGRNAQNELEATRPSWQGVFHVEQSVTDPDSAVVVATGIKQKGRR